MAVRSTILIALCSSIASPAALSARQAASSSGLSSVVSSAISALNKTNGDLKSLILDLRQIDYAGFIAALSKMGVSKRGDTDDTDADPPFAISQKLPTGEVVITLNQFEVAGLAIPGGLVIIQAFRKENGSYVLADQTGDDLFLVDARKLEPLNSGPANELWLLVQGQVKGYMGDLERARIYSFDGSHFTEEWKPEDRIDLATKISGTQIDARYLSEKIYRFGGDIQNCMEEKLQLSAGGLMNLGILNHGECEDYLTAK